jgi:hypothetical protein
MLIIRKSGSNRGLNSYQIIGVLPVAAFATSLGGAVRTGVFHSARAIRQRVARAHDCGAAGWRLGRAGKFRRAGR